LDVINKLKLENVTTLAIDTSQAPFSSGFQSRKKIKIRFRHLFGNEVSVSQDAVALCDGCIEIPQLGAKAFVKYFC
jgi:tRNA G18 (ribose-2'-O)-methylase SpoU